MSDQPPSEGNNQPPGSYGPPQGPYGGGYPPHGYGPPRPPDHPEAITVLVLGILSVVVCPLIGPFAWSKGNHAMEEINASGGAIGGYNMVQAGRICGIVGSAIVGFYVAVMLLVLIIALVGALLGA